MGARARIAHDEIVPAPSAPPGIDRSDECAISEHDLRTRAMAGRGRSQALCGGLVRAEVVQSAVARLGPAPRVDGGGLGTTELAALAVVARMVREDLLLLREMIATLGSLSPAERAVALRA